jgi:hypothetical protein
VVLVVKEVSCGPTSRSNFLNCDRASDFRWGYCRVSVTSADFPTKTRCLRGYPPRGAASRARVRILLAACKTLESWVLGSFGVPAAIQGR